MPTQLHHRAQCEYPPLPLSLNANFHSASVAAAALNDIHQRVWLSHDLETMFLKGRALILKVKASGCIFSAGDRMNQQHLNTSGKKKKKVKGICRDPSKHEFCRKKTRQPVCLTTEHLSSGTLKEVGWKAWVKKLIFKCVSPLLTNNSFSFSIQTYTPGYP